MRRMGFFIELTDWGENKIWININNIAEIQDYEAHIQISFMHSDDTTVYRESKKEIEKAISKIFHEEQDKIEKISRFEIMDI